jgi:hypothetical protein
MPKFTPKVGNNWLIEVTKRDESDNRIYLPDGKVAKEKIPMSDARFNDGTPQPLYISEGHPQAGVFKGMVVILEERGFDTKNLCVSAKILNAHPQQLTAVAGGCYTISLILCMSTASLRPHSRHEDFKYYSYRNSIAN